MFGLFNNSQAAPINKPEWAAIFSDSEFLHFKDLIEKHYAGQDVTFDWNAGTITNNSDERTTAVVSLSRACKQHPQTNWAPMIDNFFDTMQKSHLEQAELEKVVDDFEKVKSKIITRVVPAEYANLFKEFPLIHRQDLPDTVTAVFFNLQYTTTSAKSEYLSKWGKTAEEVIEIGLENVKNLPGLDVSDQALDKEGHVIKFVASHDQVAPSFALMLDAKPELVGKYGSLFTVPSVDYLLVYPINDMEVLGVLQKLVYLTMSMFEGEPKPLSQRLFFYRQSKTLEIPVEITAESFKVSPSQEFIDVLNEIAEAGKADETKPS
jgi:hypothetical protein